MALQGRFDYQLDEKNRFRIPIKLKDSLGNGPFVLFKIPGKSHYNIASQEVFDELIFDKFGSSTEFSSDKRVQAAIRTLSANSTELEEDKQGRYTLPKKIRENPNIVFDKNIVFISVQNSIELWPQEALDEHLAEWEKEAESLFGSDD